ncbi:hypothetical protein [Urbifossiella limnaea]|uniref:Uncharacterized protein n=1 Tax=Urbifossiella limnaea TaxID=2528023 RepID=A0A517XUP2_9BACT|nr:hypothetical protein [Urbifossiella limnaea]QDU21216.1 hypothetical protein ETAA1_31810 [Urbifossiella limnaea]
MSATTFPCPFCGRKMGVGPDLLGRKVRCPNCKEVLVAPVPSPPAPPVAVAPPPPPPPPVPAADFPVFNLPNLEQQDSIFGEAAEQGDDVFGSDPGRLPVPEMPPVVSPPPPPVATFTPPVAEPAPPVAAHAAPAADPFAGFTAAPAYAPPAQPVAVPAPPAVPAAAANPWADFDQAAPPVATYAAPPAPIPAAVVPAAPPPEPRRRDRRPEREERPAPARGRPAPAAGGSLNTLIKIGFFALIPYALLMTVLAVYGLFVREGKPPEGHPLSLIPDGRGEFPPPDRKKTGKLAVPLDGPLPPELRAGLGKKVTVGDVEVEPVAVAVRKLSVVREPDRGKTQTQFLSRGVVLTLNVRNTSADLWFHPLDPAFNRKTFPSDVPPTALVVGKDTFAGGPVAWPFDKNVKRAYESAQAGDDQPLGPGESRKYVVTSDARDVVVKAVQGARDTMLWRVQVRRGLVEYRGREVPVTALIGVEFQASDVTEEN